jgi:hypothetical protein
MCEGVGAAGAGCVGSDGVGAGMGAGVGAGVQYHWFGLVVSGLLWRVVRYVVSPCCGSVPAVSPWYDHYVLTHPL